MSTDEHNARDALTALGVGPAAKELYVDLLRPAAAETGKNLLDIAKLITMALTPLHGLVWGFDKIRDWLSAALLKRLATVAPDQIQPPAPHVAGQVLLQLPFCADQEQLREMYANLLASAMSRPSAGDVHPAFVHIIQQLTPDEALVLQRMSAAAKPFELHESFDEHGRLLKGIHVDPIPAQFRVFCESAGVQDAARSNTYLDNLLRLRVLEEQRWTEGELHARSHYGFGVPMGERELVLANKNGRLIELSAFGQIFLRTCVAFGSRPK